MVMHIRKPENKSTLFRGNEDKNSEKGQDKIEAGFAGFLYKFELLKWLKFVIF